jgi:hypothetical protein
MKNGIPVTREEANLSHNSNNVKRNRKEVAYP